MNEKDDWDEEYDKKYTEEEIEQAEKDIEEWIKEGETIEFDQEPCPSLEWKQIVNVVSGKHVGRSGKVERVRGEGEHGMRIELVDDAGDRFFVDKEEIDHKFEAVQVVLYMDDDERAEFLEVCELPTPLKGRGFVFQPQPTESSVGFLPESIRFTSRRSNGSLPSIFPCFKIILAAFRSRSCTSPQRGQSHSRSDNRRSCLMKPQPLHVLLDGNQRSRYLTVLPYQPALYSNCLRVS